VITPEMIDAGARGLANLLDHVGAEYDQLPDRIRGGLRVRAEAVLRAAAPDRAEPSDRSTSYRLSPAGVLVWRDLRREPGWAAPHWSVQHVPAGDRSHHIGQRLTDQAVAGWSPLIRRNAS